MSARDVLVTSYDKSSTIVSRTDGVSFGDFILLHCGHFLPLLEHSNWKKLFKSVRPSIADNVEAKDFINENMDFSIYEAESEDIVLPEGIERVGRRVVIAGIWKCPPVEKTLDMFQLGGSVPKDDSVLTCLSSFVVFEIPKEESDRTLMQKMDRIAKTMEVPARGDNVIIELTPGKIQSFVSCWCRGSICHVFGIDNCMFLMGTAFLSENAGAPVYKAHSRFYSVEKGALLGVVIGGIGDLKGFSCGISLAQVLGWISPNFRIVASAKPSLSVIKLVDDSVVMIFSGNFQGSGVVVDAKRGVVLTCCHVIAKDETKAKIYQKGKIVDCDVVYRTRNCDLAVLKVPPHSLKGDMEIADLVLRPGDAVYLAGFPDILPFIEEDERPFVIRGYISKSLLHAIVSSSIVSKGISGGAIISNGKLAGLVSLGTSVQTGFAFAVPAAVFRNQVRSYIETGEIAHLRELDSSNENLIRFWNLENSKL